MTDVTLKFTGYIKTFMQVDRMEFSFDGATLGELLEALFFRYELRDMILDEAGNVFPYSRVAVNGRFSYLVGNLDTPVMNGDLVVLIRPYVVAF